MPNFPSHIPDHAGHSSTLAAILKCDTATHYGIIPPRLGNLKSLGHGLFAIKALDHEHPILIINTNLRHPHLTDKHHLRIGAAWLIMLAYQPALTQAISA